MCAITKARLQVSMELFSNMVVLVWIFGALVALKWLLKNANLWLHETRLGEKRYSLPPGDLGWPVIGNMWSFLRAFKSSDPDSFISSYVSRSIPSLPLSLSHSLCLCLSLSSCVQVSIFTYTYIYTCT